MKGFWGTIFRNDLKRAETELVSWVRLGISDDLGVEREYYVKEIDRKNNRLNYFDPLKTGNYSMEIPPPNRVTFLGAGEDELLGYDFDFNRKLMQIHRRTGSELEYMRNKRLRVGYSVASGNPVYMLPDCHYVKLAYDETDKWPDLPFHVMALDEDVGNGEHYHAFTYYATHGTKCITVDIAEEWEPNPFSVDLQAQRDRKLLAEYNEYLKADHFKNGDLIQKGNSMPEVFIRYLDEDRSSMMVYPAGEVKGIRNIMSYRLIQRGYSQNTVEPEIKES